MRAARAKRGGTLSIPDPCSLSPASWLLAPGSWLLAPRRGTSAPSVSFLWNDRSDLHPRSRPRRLGLHRVTSAPRHGRSRATRRPARIHTVLARRASWHAEHRELVARDSDRARGIPHRAHSRRLGGHHAAESRAAEGRQIGRAHV